MKKLSFWRSFCYTYATSFYSERHVHMIRKALFTALLALVPAVAVAQDDFGSYFANTIQPGFEDPVSAEALANIAPAAGDETVQDVMTAEEEAFVTPLNEIAPAAGEEDALMLDPIEAQEMMADPLSYTP